MKYAIAAFDFFAAALNAYCYAFGGQHWYNAAVGGGVAVAGIYVLLLSKSK